MAENLLANRSDRGRTFTVVVWVIGLAFAIQALLVASAFLLRPERQIFSPPGEIAFYPPPPAEIEANPLATTTVEAEVPIGDGPAVGTPSEVTAAPERGGSIPARPVAPTPPRETVPLNSSAEISISDLNIALAQARATAPPISDTILARLVDTGEELRASGNMQGALQALSKAEAAYPEHPRILSQMAATYQEMGVNQTASEYWAEVIALGSAASGPYFDIANRVRNREPLLGSVSEPEPVDRAAPSELGSVLAIGEVKVDEQPPGDSGQRVSLRIVVDSVDGGNHVGEDLSLFVFFYDLVNGDQILESTADTSYLYPTEPYDWEVNGKEEFIVNYNQPKFSEEEIIELGQRQYYGYAIQLYYRDALQDTVVMPAEISRLRLEPPAATAPPGGFPGGARPERIGPENALFPQTPDL